MYVLVTGGYGFIGSHIVEKLIKQGHHVRILDNLSTGKITNVNKHKNKKVDRKIQFIKGDICDVDICREAIKGCDAVCHLAADISVSKSVEDPVTCHNANVNGFFNVLNVARENNIKRVVFSSTSAIYGDNTDTSKTELSTGRIISPYALSKNMNEMYARLFTDIYDMECIGLRYFNVYGQRQNQEGGYAAVIPTFVKLLKNNERPVIYGDGSFVRDFVYIDDVVDANILALTTQEKDCFGEIYNIGSGIGTSICDLVKNINIVLGKKIEPIFKQERLGDVKHSIANVKKARKHLGYIPKYNLVSGLREML